MTTTTALTCRELYDCNPTFAAGINTWVADRRCPIGLGDLLEELGLPSAADCARWAATDPDTTDTIAGKTFVGGPYPGEPSCGQYRWLRYDRALGGTHECRDVPLTRLRRHLTDSEDALSAILWLLDNWIPA